MEIQYFMQRQIQNGVNAGNEGKPAWCYFDNDPANGDNWYAVNDPRGLAPEGWHIPSEVEWKMLSGFLGGDKLAGIKMKSITGWNGVEELDVLGEPSGKILNGNGTNESGFSGLPGGSRQLDFDNFYNLGYNSYWWSSTEVHSNDAYCHSLEN